MLALLFVSFCFSLRFEDLTGCGESGASAACHVMSCRVVWCCGVSCRVMPCRVLSCHVRSCHVTSRHVTSRHVTSRHVTSRHVTSCRLTSCQVLSRQLLVQCASRISRRVVSCCVACRVMSAHVIRHVSFVRERTDKFTIPGRCVKAGKKRIFGKEMVKDQPAKMR